MSSDIYKYTQRQEAIKRLRELVSAAGGEFAGVQETLLAAWPALLGFNNPETGKYLVVPFNPVCFSGIEILTSVQARVAQDNLECANRRVSVKATDIQRISKRLLELSQEIDALIERKKS